MGAQQMTQGPRQWLTPQHSYSFPSGEDSPCILKKSSCNASADASAQGEWVPETQSVADIAHQIWGDLRVGIFLAQACTVRASTTAIELSTTALSLK